MGICSAGFLLLVAGRVFTAHFLVEQSGLGLRNAGVVVTVLGLVGGAAGAPRLGERSPIHRRPRAPFFITAYLLPRTASHAASKLELPIYSSVVKTL